MTFSTKIQYLLLMGSCKVIGLLPDCILYHTLGPLIYFVLYKVVRYRRSVVRTNLSNSFPEKTTDELRHIERRFYRHLAEVFVDTIKLATISRKEILDRMVYRDVDKMEEAMQGKSWISAMSHYGSWELTTNYICHTDHITLRPGQSMFSISFMVPNYIAGGHNTFAYTFSGNIRSRGYNFPGKCGRYKGI